ncbi:MAG TPA: RHS repeat-associated core domain-containing protein [Pyrinomonadaceae bacterium]|nr:RHS repeat-associated core domain-containing protein [Pyrinomonadaceae bacterium]
MLPPHGSRSIVEITVPLEFQPDRFTTYERDAPESDDAMHRRYNRWWSRFDQPDPYDGSYSLAAPQSFNRYAYVQNDPVNFVDPSGLLVWPINIGNVGDVTVYAEEDPFDDPFFRGYGGGAAMPMFRTEGIVGGGIPGGGVGIHETGHTQRDPALKLILDAKVDASSRMSKVNPS